MDGETASKTFDLGRGRSARQFWEVPASGWRDIIRRTFSKTSEQNLSLLAAGVAFYSFLAFVPLLASIVLLYGIFADPADVAKHIQSLMTVLPRDAAKIVADQLQTLTQTPVSRTSLGPIVAILLALYGAMRGATSIIIALNIAYSEKETRSVIQTTGLSFAFTLGAVAVAIIASIAIGALGVIGGLVTLPSIVGTAISVGLWIATAILASGLIAVLYRYGPDREDAQWSWLAPGSLFASLGSLIATFLFGLYVSHFGAYNAAYGALGAVVSFLMWLYVTAFVVLLGAEFNAELEHQTSHDTTTGAPLPEGSRGAEMADTTAGMALAPPSNLGPTARVGNVRAIKDLQPMLAGAVVVEIVSRVSGKSLGAPSMGLVSAGTAMLVRRGHTGKALACLGMAGLLIWRHNSGKASWRRGGSSPDQPPKRR